MQNKTPYTQNLIRNNDPGTLIFHSPPKEMSILLFVSGLNFCPTLWAPTGGQMLLTASCPMGLRMRTVSGHLFRNAFKRRNERFWRIKIFKDLLIYRGAGQQFYTGTQAVSVIKPRNNRLSSFILFLLEFSDNTCLGNQTKIKTIIEFQLN